MPWHDYNSFGSVETGSKKAAYTALIDDLGIAIAKLITAIFTGSIAMDTYNSNQYHVKKTLVNDPKKAENQITDQTRDDLIVPVTLHIMTSKRFS